MKKRCVLLSIYVDEDEKLGRKPLYRAVLDLLWERDVHGVTVFKGVYGYGPDKKVHTARLLRASENLPVKIEVVETLEKVEEILPELEALLTRGLITVAELYTICHKNPPCEGA
jgi:PII-like signaling protein